MAGKDILSFVDLGKDTVESHPVLLGWIFS